MKEIPLVWQIILSFLSLLLFMACLIGAYIIGYVYERRQIRQKLSEKNLNLDELEQRTKRKGAIDLRRN